MLSQEIPALPLRVLKQAPPRMSILAKILSDMRSATDYFVADIREDASEYANYMQHEIELLHELRGM